MAWTSRTSATRRHAPDGNCRACVVEIKGERVLAPSCCRQPAKGMEVASDSPRALHSQKLVLELLKADAPAADLKPGGNELAYWSARLGVGTPRFEARCQPPRTRPPRDVVKPRRLHPVHALRARLPRGAGE